jgi:hypothetical protein
MILCDVAVWVGYLASMSDFADVISPMRFRRCNFGDVMIAHAAGL